MAEIAQMLDVVRQYVDRLSRDDPAFPEPVATLASEVWKRADIVKWAKATGVISSVGESRGFLGHNDGARSIMQPMERCADG